MTGRNTALKSNLWKYFIFAVSQRRNFIPILAIYYLTLPSSTAQQIGLYMGIGFLMSFLLEIPSGYFADRFGHKRTLILSKLLMIASTACFVFGNSFIYFAFGSAFLNVSFAFQSGTHSAFIHETLVGLKRGKDYTKVMSKISANVSIISAVLILLLPFLTKINMILPLQVGLFFDIAGLFAVLNFVNPNVFEKITKETAKSIWHVMKEIKKINFYPPAIFSGLLTGFFVGSVSFKEIYLQSLGFPVIFIGSVMALSRVLWFVIGNNIYRFEKHLNLKRLFSYELFLFPLFFLLIAYFSNPYLVGFLFALIGGWLFGRTHLIIGKFIDSYTPDKKYKATVLSIKGQISKLLQSVVSLGIGFFMQHSYKLGYYIISACLFVSLAVTYGFIKKR